MRSALKSIGLGAKSKSPTAAPGWTSPPACVNLLQRLGFRDVRKAWQLFEYWSRSYRHAARPTPRPAHRYPRATRLRNRRLGAAAKGLKSPHGCFTQPTKPAPKWAVLVRIQLRPPGTPSSKSHKHCAEVLPLITARLSLRLQSGLCGERRNLSRTFPAHPMRFFKRA